MGKDAKRLKAVMFGVALLALTACSQRADDGLIIFNGQTMGTYYRVSVVGSPELPVERLQQQIDAVLEAVNQSMSTYLETSEISRFNRAGANQAIELTEPTVAVLKEAMAISTLTDGAFDITVGPLVRLWGFGAEGNIERMPDPNRLAAARAAVGQRFLKLDGRLLVKSHNATEIDLSAIAKGYAIDQVAELLLQQTIDHWLIDVGGELRASGQNVDRPWQVAIERPSAAGGIEQVVELKNRAIATSGDYRNFVVLDGKVFSHAIDPATGYPVRHKLSSASVLHDRAATADAYATALLIMGEERALEFAIAQDLSVFLISRGEIAGEFKITETGEFTSPSQ